MSTVLIVDDDAVNRELLVEMLSSAGIDTECAMDGLDCIEQFARVKPDLVLLDIEMPRMDGLTTCRFLKSDPNTRLVPIVLVTAKSAFDDRICGIQAGADDFITKPVERSQLLARTKSLLNLKAFTDELERAETVLFSLALTIEGKDQYTQGHCERLSNYGSRLGEQLGLEKEEIIALKRAGVVHDVGKVAVPDSILLKPTRLTEVEKAVMVEHPVIGERICKPLRSFAKVLPIIRHHHERMDGSGYPDRLRGGQIPLTARVLQTVDVFDALTTVRPYKKAFSTGDALEIMHYEVKKGWWDPDVVKEFEKLLQQPSQLGAGEYQRKQTACV